MGKHTACLQIRIPHFLNNIRNPDTWREGGIRGTLLDIIRYMIVDIYTVCIVYIVCIVFIGCIVYIVCMICMICMVCTVLIVYLV